MGISKPPLGVLKGCNKLSLGPSLLQAKQTQFSWPFLRGKVFHPPSVLYFGSAFSFSWWQESGSRMVPGTGAHSGVGGRGTHSQPSSQRFGCSCLGAENLHLSVLQDSTGLNPDGINISWRCWSSLWNSLHSSFLTTKVAPTFRKKEPKWVSFEFPEMKKRQQVAFPECWQGQNLSKLKTPW